MRIIAEKMSANQIPASILHLEEEDNRQDLSPWA